MYLILNQILDIKTPETTNRILLPVNEIKQASSVGDGTTMINTKNGYIFVSENLDVLFQKLGELNNGR